MVRDVVIHLDAISDRIPILLSRRTLPLMGAVLNFTNCPIRLANGDLIQPNEQKSGHKSLPVDILPFQSSGKHLVGEEAIIAAEGGLLARAEIKKLHLHTGHDDAPILRQMIQNAGRVCSPDTIQEVIKIALASTVVRALVLISPIDTYPHIRDSRRPWTFVTRKRGHVVSFHTWS